MTVVDRSGGVSAGSTVSPPTLDQLVLEVLAVLLTDSTNQSQLTFTEHTQCSVLSDGLRGKLCSRLDRGPGRMVQQGERLYGVGSQAESVYLLQSGVMKTSVPSPRADQLTLRIYTTGEVLGELCLCERLRREEAIALEPSRVVEISLPDLLAELRRDPEAALDLVSSICERLAEAYRRVRSVSIDPVMRRLVEQLLKLTVEVGESSPAGIRLGGYITQEELARLVGASREATSRLLNRLRESGLISYSPRGPITVRPAALQAFLDSITRR
jgi:CRP/FNR family transcriptional regulator, cyclic AMP receptor protein